jgi:hypothetical protein
MSKTSFIVLMSIALTVLTYYGPLFPNDFDSKTASDKLAYLKQKIVDDKGESNSYFSKLQMAPIALPELIGGARLGPVITNQTDQVLKDYQKLIHTVAKTGAIELRMINHSAGYTGCFAAGVTCQGFARASSAVEPTNDTNVPGIAFKILRDGKPSASLLALWKSAGQQEPNFFQNPFSNHGDAIPGGFSLDSSVLNLKVLQKKFSGYDADPSMTGLSNLANMNPNGTPVAIVKSPFQLVLQPNPAMKTMCDSHPGFDSNGTYKCLEKITAGNTLYKIFAVANPKLHPVTADLVLVGTVVATSSFSNSAYFDKYVQFGHTLWAQERKNMGSQGNVWHDSTRGDYVNTGGAPKFKDVLPAW